MAFIRQTITLTNKNLLIVFLRHPLATVVRALLLPIILTAFLSFARNLFVPPAINGIADSRLIRSLGDGIRQAGGTGRDTVVFVNNGFQGGDIERVIENLSGQLTAVGKNVIRLSDESRLNSVCKSSLRGVSGCYGAIVFHGSPNEGLGGIWNYTLRLDAGLSGGKIDVTKDNNDGQIFVLPLQRAVDSAITSLDPTNGRSALPNNTHEYMFTELTQQERAERIRVLYQQAVTNFMGVAFIVGVIGICYHMTGFIATEREIGMSTLIESMMTTKHRWQAQAARLLSYHIAFSILYLPGWVIGSVILQTGVFAHTSTAVSVFYHMLAGLALASMSVTGAAFFKKSQLSGVTVTILLIVLAIVAQAISYPSTVQVAVLSLLFAPCNYVFFVTYMARWERKQWPTDLTKVGPDSPWELPGIVLWVFLVVQIIVYPVVGALIERYLYGTGTSGRTILPQGHGQNETTAAVQLEGFTKVYSPGLIRRMFTFISRPKEPVRAVDGLTLSAGRGQILALLGANGSGKSTTLDAIAGISRLTSGKITIDGTGGLGIAPQKNVLWDEVTVEEHVRIFDELKSPHARASKEETRQLVASVDLEKKLKAHAVTLSGGQRRKLQLGMMLTGGSAVCCVDEVSSGLDPLSRRKIWDILLAERGRRTIIMTTHFLDEADLLADHIAVLSKGTLRAEGSSVELKDRLGGGYRIHLQKTKTLTDGPEVDGVVKKDAFDVVSYIAPSSGLAAQVIRTLEGHGIRDYRFSGPTIEDVFLQLAEEVRGENGVVVGGGGSAADDQAAAAEKTPSSEGVDELAAAKGVGAGAAGGGNLELLSGERVGIAKQAWVLFMKRCTVFKHNWVPYFAAFIIPVLAAGLVTLFIRGQKPVGCTPAELGTEEEAENIFTSGVKLYFVAGPSERFTPQALLRLFLPLFGGGSGNSTSGGSATSPSLVANITALARNITLVNSLDEFNRMIVDQRKNVTPAGWWLGDANTPPTLAYDSGPEIINALFGQNLMNSMLTNTTLAAGYAPFDIPWLPDTGNSLQLLVYVGLALCAYPGFFALYPNLERRRNVRGLEYSNGVREFPLWTAYLLFDFCVVLASTALVTVLFASLSSVWYHVGFLFLVFMLYGLASILVAYIVSLFAKNQLSAYAFTAAGQALMFLVYLIAYMCTITYAPVNRIDYFLLVVHFVVAAFAPIGSAMRALFLALNLFSATCDGEQLAPNPGGILQYGGPILYLVLQSVFLFVLLLWLDSGTIKASWQRLFARRRRSGTTAEGGADVSDEEVANELVRVTSTATGGSTAAGRRSGRRKKSNADAGAGLDVVGGNNINININSTGTGTGTDTSDSTSDSDRDGLQVVHLTKTFGKMTAVDNVTFGIKRGEVFALLGPNGAGKSTTISMIRGDLQPSPRTGGDILVEGVSVTKHLAAARSHLGVCPQFDAVDQMTVAEHLRFYAKVRGIPDVEHNVAAVLRAVGLGAFRDRQAHALSGGNKRKLSLGIALMGNPSVVLLDEPSSGLDAAAKRVMWRTLAATVPGRSILLTTHSMEEADALAGRAGILAKRMLAMGSAEQLRSRFGNVLHVHIVCRGAPRTTDADAGRVRAWVVGAFPRAEVEEKMYHGQLRFTVPAEDVPGVEGGVVGREKEKASPEGVNGITRQGGKSAEQQSAIGRLVVLLEEQRAALGLEHYSVSPTTLDQVFLTIVGRHNVQEEGYREEKKPTGWWARLVQRA